MVTILDDGLRGAWGLGGEIVVDAMLLGVIEGLVGHVGVAWMEKVLGSGGDKPTRVVIVMEVT